MERYAFGFPFLLNAGAAQEAAPAVARLMAEELGRDDRWVAGQAEAFSEIVSGYRVG